MRYDWELDSAEYLYDSPTGRSLDMNDCIVELNRLDQRRDELEKENAELKADLKHFEAIKKNIRDKYKNANQVFGLNLGTVIKEGSTNEK